MLDDGEAEAGTAEVARTGVVDAVEALEQARVVLGRDAGAGVGDDDADLLALELGLPTGDWSDAPRSDGAVPLELATALL